MMKLSETPKTRGTSDCRKITVDGDCLVCQAGPMNGNYKEQPFFARFSGEHPFRSDARQRTVLSVFVSSPMLPIIEKRAVYAKLGPVHKL